MNSFQPRRIQKAGRVPDDHPSIAAEWRQRPPSTVGQRLCAVADHLAAFQQSSDEGMLLESLQHVLWIEAGIAIIETGDKSERNSVVFGAVNPGAAVFFRGQRITHGVDDFASFDAAGREFP